MGVGGEHHAPAAFLRERDPVPILPEAGSAPDSVWTGVENSPSPVFKPQTVQPVASRYPDCTFLTPAERKARAEINTRAKALNLYPFTAYVSFTDSSRQKFKGFSK
jgi:hypothetical protein